MPAWHPAMSTPIGVYDSGFGGLSVLQAIRASYPQHDLCYLADTAYCPYGPRTATEVQQRAVACTGWLIERGAQLVVVACNTASAAALELLRATFNVPIVGMEPGVKPAIHATRNNRIGVLATDGTLTSARFQTLLSRYAADADVQAVPCPGLVDQVESGDLTSAHARDRVSTYVTPLQQAGVDTLVLGCTHFNFLSPLIAEVAGNDVTIIDTAPAVARRVGALIERDGIPVGTGELYAATTGDPAEVAPVMERMLQIPIPVTYANC